VAGQSQAPSILPAPSETQNFPVVSGHGTQPDKWSRPNSRIRSASVRSSRLTPCHSDCLPIGFRSASATRPLPSQRLPFQTSLQLRARPAEANVSPKAEVEQPRADRNTPLCGHRYYSLHHKCLHDMNEGTPGTPKAVAAQSKRLIWDWAWPRTKSLWPRAPRFCGQPGGGGYLELSPNGESSRHC